MPTAEVGDQTLYYEVHGEGEPLVLVMGLSGDTLAWLPQIPVFSERYRTVVFDNRDVGRSSMASGSYEIADMARDALGLLGELELDSFHLLGLSMGGAIAQEMALAAPERIKTLTLAVTFCWSGAWSRKLSEVWGARAQHMSREERVDELLLLNHTEEFFENQEALGWLRGMILQNPNPQPADAFARQLDACSRHDTRDRLETLSMPVHVIGGNRDILVPIWKSQELAELVPGAKLSVIEGGPHGSWLERAEEFNRLVLDFVAEHSTARV
jgi:3-oxoadipate enol-lactonase